EDGRVAVLAGGALALRAADVFDAGLYHCIGTARGDADALSFRITVLDPHVQHDGVNGARLETAPGGTLHLPCTSTAAPDAAVTWGLPERTVLRQSAGNKHIFANGTLRIQGVTERDVGYFRCVAANRYGVDLLVFQVLMRQDESALKKKHGALGEWEEGSGSEMLRSVAAQRQPSGTPAALGEPAASAASSQGAQRARQRNSHRKMPRWPHGDRTGRRFRGHRRQFVSSGRRADPQRWAALLEKTAKRNLTVTDKRGEVATEPPIQVPKLSEVPEDEEETSGDLISPEEEFMIAATERIPVSALGRATELTITAGPKETPNSPPAWNTSLLPTEPSAPLPSPLPHSVPPASKRPQTLPKLADSQKRSDLSEISANGVKQSTVSSGTSASFPAGQKSIYSGESNNQHLKSASMTPMTEATGTSKAVTPQNTADKLHAFTESTENVSTKTDHQVPVATVNAGSEFGPIYFHNTQKGGTSNPPLASTSATHQQIWDIQDIPTHPPQLQQHYGRRRKISGRRRIVRPGSIPGMKEHRYNFGRPGSARGSTAVATGVQLNMNYASKVPTLNNFSSSTNPFSPEAPQSSPSTMNMPLEHPVGSHQTTALLREEEKKRGARQKAAPTVMSVIAKDTATTATSGLGVTGLEPTVTLVITPQTNTRVTKSKILRVGGRRGQRRKRPPKTPAPQHVAAAQSPAATPAVGTAAPPAMGTAQSPAATPAVGTATTPAASTAQSPAATPAVGTAATPAMGTAQSPTATPAESTAHSPAATPAASTAQSPAATPAASTAHSPAVSTAQSPTATPAVGTAATPAVSTAQSPAATPAMGTATPTVAARTSPAVPPSLTPVKPLPGSVSAGSTTRAAALGIPVSPEAPQHRPRAATQTPAAPGTWRSTQSATPLPGRVAAQSLPRALQSTPGTPRNTQLATSPAASPAQTPAVGLQSSPWLGEPVGATRAPPAAVSATPGPAPAQHVRATAAAGGKPPLSPAEGAVQERQAAQPGPAARAAPPGPPPRAPEPPRGDGQLRPRPPPRATER
ncbi:IGS10 protein, partial [Phainopepla nitens]|nr:IGS10 protein [Phainopepla nitens]